MGVSDAALWNRIGDLIVTLILVHLWLPAGKRTLLQIADAVP